MAIKAVCYFLCTSMICALVGLSMVLIVHPGSPEIKDKLRHETRQATSVADISALDTILDLLRYPWLCLESASGG